MSGEVTQEASRRQYGMKIAKMRINAFENGIIWQIFDFMGGRSKVINQLLDRDQDTKKSRRTEWAMCFRCAW